MPAIVVRMIGGFGIQLEWIKHISLSPWLPGILAESLVEHLQSICGCSKLCISRSRVIDFDKWQAAADEIVQKALR